MTGSLTAHAQAGQSGWHAPGEIQADGDKIGGIIILQTEFKRGWWSGSLVGVLNDEIFPVWSQTNNRPLSSGE